MKHRVAPRVSVITPCYDSEEYIGRTIRSLLAQTLADWEQVVVDDGSPGDVVGTVVPYLSDPRIRLIRQANGGLCNARNAGFRACASESRYLLFLDADDVLEPKMLEALVGELDAHPEVGMAFCDRILIDGQNRLVDAYRDDLIRRFVPAGRLGVRLLPSDCPDTPFESFFAYNIAVPSLTLLRRSVYEAVGGWDERLGPFYEDTDMWLRVTLRTEAHYLPCKLLRRRLHGHQLTRSPESEQRRREGMRKFERKWESGAWLTHAERAVVEQAQLFKRGRLMPYLWFSWAGERLRRGELVEAAKCWLRGCRDLLRYTPGALAVSGCWVAREPKSP